MGGKKEYLTVLTILDSIGTAALKANKLSKLGIDSEDPQITKVCGAICNVLNRSLKLPGHLPTEIARQKKAATRTGVMDDLIKVVDAATAICTKEIASVQPQWQRIALAAGWTPPAP
ncbi:hypothetical protein [Massilia sp. TSP1-1-2]|uniref:hypothetical protein n=1 Tax=Massilia sp. TSP1-1-2 TaxID=2804649 RepID=UPI003CEE2718